MALTEHQLARKDLQDTIRTIVRLTHRIATRRELNEIEASILGEYDRRAATGQPFKPDLKGLISGELG